MKVTPKYYVVQIDPDQGVQDFDEYVCVPWTWIKLKWPENDRLLVYYPNEDPEVREKHVKNRQKCPKEGSVYLSTQIYTTDSYEDAQNKIKKLYKNQHKSVKSSKIKNGDHKQSVMLKKKRRKSKRNEKSYHKVEMSTKDDGKPVLKLKRVVISSPDKEADKKRSRGTESNEPDGEEQSEEQWVPRPVINQPNFYVIQFLQFPSLDSDEYVCIPWSWMRVRGNINQTGFVSYPLENPSVTEGRVKKEQRFLDWWNCYGAVVKYSTDSYKDAQLCIKKIYKDLYKDHVQEPSKTNDYEEEDIVDVTKKLKIKKRKSNRNEMSSLKVDKDIHAESSSMNDEYVTNTSKFDNKVDKNQAKVTVPAESEAKIEEQSLQAFKCSNENELATHEDLSTQEVSAQRSNVGSPGLVIDDPINENAHKYCVIQFLQLPYEDIDAYVCIPWLWVIYEHTISQNQPYRSKDRKVIVKYPVENPSITEQRVINYENFSKQWLHYKAVVRYSTDVYKQAQYCIKFMTDYENKCLNINNRVLVNETVTSIEYLNQKVDILMEDSSKNDGKVALLATDTEAESDEELDEESCQAFDYSIKHQMTSTHEDLCTQEVSSQKSNVGIPDKENTDLMEHKLQYLVIEFLQLPHKDIDDYVCVPESWITSRRKTDRKAMVAYPVEELTDTEKRVQNNEDISPEWISYLSVVKHTADCYEDAQMYIFEMTPVDNQKKRAEIVKRILQNRRMQNPDEEVDDTSSEVSEPSESDSEDMEQSEHKTSNEHQLLQAHEELRTQIAFLQRPENEIPFNETSNLSSVQNTLPVNNNPLNLSHPSISVARELLPKFLQLFQQLHATFIKTSSALNKICNLTSQYAETNTYDDVPTATTLKTNTGTIHVSSKRKRNNDSDYDDIKPASGIRKKITRRMLN